MRLKERLIVAMRSRYGASGKTCLRCTPCTCVHDADFCRDESDGRPSWSSQEMPTGSPVLSAIAPSGQLVASSGEVL
jgi:hypothetical protein